MENKNNIEKIKQFLSIKKNDTLLVNQVLANKKYKKEIVDKKRISKILKEINKKSKKTILTQK